MIGLRVQCDFEGCGRHFEAGGHELRPMAAVATHAGLRGRAGIYFHGGTVVLPEGWAVGDERAGELRVLCAHHAP